MNIEISHIIDDQHKEIYAFEKIISIWHYTGIGYSNRNDKDDVWGDEWDKHYSNAKEKELNDYAVSRGYQDFDEFCDSCTSYIANDYYDGIISDIYDKYNPVCQKTLDGRTYWYGLCFGSGCDTAEYAPKLSEEEIKHKILKQICNLKIQL